MRTRRLLAIVERHVACALGARHPTALAAHGARAHVRGKGSEWRELYMHWGVDSRRRRGLVRRAKCVNAERLRAAPVPPAMLIKVKNLAGREIEIDIEPTDTIERIKERVEEKEGIPPPQQRLIFGGRALSDEKTAADYNITAGMTLHLVLALRGGF